jgi:predicted NBD/HSP70 family sugar kinase/biotin operon repressor
MKREQADDWKNTHAVMRCIEESPQTPSRASIAKQLSLSRTTISTIASQLIESGLVTEMDSAVQGRGRPGIPLSLDTRRWFALGAAFQGRTWMFLIVDLKGNIVVERTASVADRSSESFIETLIEGLRAMIGGFSGRLLPLIGIGSPGLVNSDSGVILRADDMGWKNIPLGGIVEERVGLPAMVMNRNRASGLAEAKFGAGRHVSPLVYVGIGTGISAALMNKGRLLDGRSSSAGEIGHMVVDPNGPLCGCGRYGCLQALASSSALVRLAKERHQSLQARGEPILPNPLWNAVDDETRFTGEFICAEANAGNPVGVDCLKEMARYLGIAVGNIINMVNPEKIIIGGTLGNSGPLLTRLIAEEAEKHAMAAPMAVVAIEQSRLGTKAAALGATSLPLSRKVDLAVP